MCTGTRPLAITNCLNFGNPYDPEVYWQFKEAVRGIGEACRFLNTPVTGESSYNEGPLNAVYPTPIIGMLGLIKDLEKTTTAVFKDDGDAIILLGKTLGHIGGSEYLATIHGTVSGDAPDLDLIARSSLDKRGAHLSRPMTALRVDWHSQLPRVVYNGSRVPERR